MKRKVMRTVTIMAIVVMALATPLTAHASNPQQAPRYQFETAFTYDQ